MNYKRNLNQVNLLFINSLCVEVSLTEELLVFIEEKGLRRSEIP